MFFHITRGSQCFLFILAILVPLIYCWPNNNEHSKQLNSLVESLNQTIHIDKTLKEIDQKYVNILRLRHIEALGQPEPESIIKDIDIVVNYCRDRQKRLDEFHNKFRSMENKFGKNEFFERYECRKYLSEILALNQTLSVVSTELIQYKQNQDELPEPIFESRLINKRLIDLKDKYPSYAEIDYLDQRLKNLQLEIENYTSISMENQKNELSKELKFNADHSRELSRMLAMTTHDLTEVVRTHRQKIPIGLYFKLSFLATLNKELEEHCSQYYTWINQGIVLNGQPTNDLSLPLSLFMLLILIFNV